MRICMSVSRLHPSADGVIVGGPINSMVTLSRTLVERGHEISILAGCPGREAAARARRHLRWADVLHVTTSAKTGGVLRGLEFAAKAIFRLTRQRGHFSRVDVFHSHSGYPQIALVARGARVLARRPAVHTLYCAVGSEVEEKRKPALLGARVARACLRHVDRIVAVSRNVARSLEELGVAPERVRVIPPSIDESVFHPDVRKSAWKRKLKIGVDEKLIMYLGNLTRTKGIDVFAEALVRLSQRGLRFKAVYALQKQHARFETRRQELRDQLARAGLGEDVLELGPVVNIAGLMAASDVFVSPLRNTNGLADYPVSIMEAMMTGRPVVATRTGGVPEVVDDQETGLLCAPGEAHDLAEKVHMVLTCPGLASRLGTRAAQAARARFSTRAVADAYGRLYEEVLSEAM